MDRKKYARMFALPPEGGLSFLCKTGIEEAPQWCSVDLRDGNQALPTPMSLHDKLAYFDMLLKIGFTEIEVGFPSASDTEYQFIRTLIGENRVPDKVSLQVLTQAREHILRRTFESLQGAKRAIIHLYNATAPISREAVFHKDEEALTAMAVSAAKLCRKLERELLPETDVRYEYSPEYFCSTEMDYSVRNLQAVLDAFAPPKERPLIVNLPSTVSISMPHVYAQQVQYIAKSLPCGRFILSVHPHNDRGCAVAEAELCVLAGASRVEGTLFGNGERTGNLDLVTMALNMLAQGVDPKLDLSHLLEVRAQYERLTGMDVPPRQPYAGDLVFAAFSGSHQDAIAKGMKWQREHPDASWCVPYLPIDPGDIGISYEGAVIRINSLSGKGGVGYLLENSYGYDLPRGMREDVGYTIKRASDHQRKELTPDEVAQVFRDSYIDQFSPLDVVEAHFKQHNGILCTITVMMNGQDSHIVNARGNGRLDAVSNALKKLTGLRYTIDKYQEHALNTGSNARAISYVAILSDKGELAWGAGTHDDIMASSVNALVSAINRLTRGDVSVTPHTAT